MILFKLAFDVGNDLHLPHPFDRQLRGRIKKANGFYFIVIEIDSVRPFIAKGKNIYNTPPDRKITGFIHKVAALKTVFQQNLYDGIYIKLFTFFDFDPGLVQDEGIHYFFKDGFGISNNGL